MKRVAQTCCLGLRLFGGLARHVGNGYMIGRPRLRRPFLYDRHIFVTVKLPSSRAELKTGDYERLAISLKPWNTSTCIRCAGAW